MISITFTGGFGAQLLSTAAYMYLSKKKINVKANFDYFDLPDKIEKYEKMGMNYTGKETFHPWQLDELGIFQNSFNINGTEKETLHDGKKKSEYALLGFSDNDIKSKFMIFDHVKNFKKELFNDESFACIHIRRGDYLKVASYLISDFDFFKIIKAISKLISNILILTDSDLNVEFKEKISNLNLNTRYAIGGSAATSHGLMRLSNILICSNSQFSFTAAMLRPDNVLTFIPSTYDGDPNADINKQIEKMRKFQIYTGL
tara:strand:- start:509 stop:1285 length:777 start_codon:yes stop_codon:yes gene_type:complete